MTPAVSARVARLLEDVQAWAAAHPDVVGAVLVGSYARQAARSDSDVDLVVACLRPDAYVQETAWADAFGEPRRIEVEPWGRVTSVRVYYADGLEVEFGFADSAWGSAPLDAGTRQVIAPGCLVLYDRGGAFAGLG